MPQYSREPRIRNYVKGNEQLCYVKIPDRVTKSKDYNIEKQEPVEGTIIPLEKRN